MRTIDEMSVNALRILAADMVQKANSGHPGLPLGAENVTALRRTLGWDIDEAFEVPEEVYAHYRELAARSADAQAQWNKLFADYCAAYPEMKALWDQHFNGDAAESLAADEEYWAFEDKPQATRNLSGVLLNRLKDRIPCLLYTSDAADD